MVSLKIVGPAKCLQAIARVTAVMLLPCHVDDITSNVLNVQQSHRGFVYAFERILEGWLQQLLAGRVTVDIILQPVCQMVLVEIVGQMFAEPVSGSDVWHVISLSLSTHPWAVCICNCTCTNRSNNGIWHAVWRRLLISEDKIQSDPFTMYSFLLQVN